MSTLIVVLSLWVAVGALFTIVAIKAGKVCVGGLPFTGLGDEVSVALMSLLWPYALWKGWDRQDENQQK